MNDVTGLAEALLGLEGFRVLGVEETPHEVIVTVETIVEVVGCSTCGVQAESEDRMGVDIRDLPCFGRPAGLVRLKRQVSRDGDRVPTIVGTRFLLCPPRPTQTCRSAGVYAPAVSRPGPFRARSVRERNDLTV